MNNRTCSFLFVLILFGFMQSCRVQEATSINTSDQECPNLAGYYKLSDYCDRLDYLELHFADSLNGTKCINAFCDDLEKETGFGGTLVGTWAGLIYDHDSVFYQDIKKWRTLLNCKIVKRRKHH